MEASKARKQFNTYTPREDGTVSLDDSIEELRREMTVRKRIYDRWLADGNITFAEGDSRMRGLMSALKWLIEMAKNVPGETLPPAENTAAF